MGPLTAHAPRSSRPPQYVAGNRTGKLARAHGFRTDPGLISYRPRGSDSRRLATEPSHRPSVLYMYDKQFCRDA